MSFCKVPHARVFNKAQHMDGLDLSGLSCGDHPIEQGFADALFLPVSFNDKRKFGCARPTVVQFAQFRNSAQLVVRKSAIPNCAD